MGSWDDENGIVLSGLEVEGGGGWEGSLNRSLTVTTILNPPYMMIKVTTISILDSRVPTYNKNAIILTLTIRVSHATY